MNTSKTILLFTLSFFCSFLYAAATEKTSECEAQFNKLLLTSVDCSFEVKPDSLQQILAYTQGAVKDASCTIPLKFFKSEIYSHWIKPNSVNLPKFQVQCQLTGSNEQKFPLTTFVQPVCSKAKEQDWNCAINMSGTEGLGMLGGILEAQINDSAILKNEMRKFLNRL